MNDPENIKKQEEEKKQQMLKQATKQRQLLQKQTIHLTKKLIEIDEQIQQNPQNIQELIKQFVQQNSEEIQNNFTLKDIDTKLEEEIINIIGIFINANKCLLELDMSEKMDEEEDI